MPDASVAADPDDPPQYAPPNEQPEEYVECVSPDAAGSLSMKCKINIFLFFMKENVNRTPPIDVKDNNYGTEAPAIRPAIKSVKLATESPPISTEYGKKDEMKMMPAVLPVMGYTAAPAPNVYPAAMDSGIQMYPGAQPAPSAYPTTTYQQGVCIKAANRNETRSHIPRF